MADIGLLGGCLASFLHLLFERLCSCLAVFLLLACVVFLRYGHCEKGWLESFGVTIRTTPCTEGRRRDMPIFALLL